MKHKFAILSFVLSIVLLFSGCDMLSDKNTENTTDNVTETTAETFDVSAETTFEKPSVFPEGFVFPKTDGSTSTTNLDSAIRSAVLGGEQKAAHTKTYTSFFNLLNAECELIFTTPLSEEQLQRMQDVGFVHEAEPVAGEGFVFVVNKDNPVDTLTVEQLKGIYSGEITNWSEVGGNDAEIIAYQRNQDSGSQNYMISFMGDTPLMEPVTDEIPATMTGILDVVANYDNGINAIGYSVYAYSDGMYENISEIKYIKVNGVEPTLETLADGSYPLLGYNYAVFSADEAEDSPVRTLVKWIQSDEGQQVVADAGYVPYRKVDGLTLPEATTKTLYNATATSGISKPEEAADYYYECRGIPDNFTAPGLSEKVQSFITEATNELSKVDEAKTREFIKARDMHSYTQDIITYKKLINGYLSISVGWMYFDGTQEANDYFYDVRTAVFDIYTGERLELSDLFFEGVDFVPLLNSTLAKEAAEPYSSFGATYDMISDFSGLYNGEFAFTADSIIFFPGTYFADGVELSIADLSEYMVTSVPRDMAGCIDGGIPINKVIRTRISDDIGYAEVKNGITIWYLDSEKMGIPTESCNKVNAFIDQIYETYFAEEKLLKFVKSKGVNAETVSVGPWPDFRITVVGNRYVMLNGANLVFASVGDKYYEFSVIEEHYNSYYFYYYFNAETGEKLQVSDLFAEGWEREAEYYALNDDFSETNGNGTSQVDFTDCRIVNIRNYTDSPYNKGDLSDLEWSVSVYVVTKAGEKVLVSVPGEYINGDATTEGATESAPLVVQSVLENKSMLYYTGTDQEMYISDYLKDRELSITKYSIVDLNSDSASEVVLWLARGNYAYYGFLILRSDGDTVYAYELTYRAFYELKEDGTFTFSAGASDHGIGKIDFADDTYEITEIAYCESEYGNQKVSYYVGDNAVSKEDFEEYITKHDQKQNVEWYEY